MKTHKGIVLSVVLLFSAMALAAGESIEKWTVLDYWQRLIPKMTEGVVVELLGEPLEKEYIKNYQIWYYQQVPQKEGDAIVSRPRSGLLRFRKVDSVYLLFECKQPDWTVTVPHSERQYLAEQEKIRQQQKEDEQSRPDRESLNDQNRALQQQQQAETQRLAAERKEALQKASEEAELKRQEQIALKQQERAEQRSRQADSTKNKSWNFELSSYKYWFTMAGLFIVGAILIGVMYKYKK